MDRTQVIRRFVLLYLIGLALQTALILGVAEPWPAIALPDFANPGGEGKRFTVEIPVLTVHFADSTKTNLNHHQFLEVFPRSLHRQVMNKNFRQSTIEPVSQDNSPAQGEVSAGELTSWFEAMKEQLSQVLRPPPSVVPATTSRGSQWIRQRFRELYPHRTPMRLEVEWYQSFQVRRGRRLQEVKRERMSHLRIQL
jgi:hypothetical protein